MLLPPIWILKFLSLQGVQVIGALLIGLLKGDGTVVLPDKNGIIFNSLTLESCTLNNLDTLVPCSFCSSIST